MIDPNAPQGPPIKDKCPIGHEKDKYGGACPTCAKAWQDYVRLKQGGQEL